MTEDSQKKDKDVFLPGAIVVAALLIAGALVYNTGSRAVDPQPGRTADLSAAGGTGKTSLLDDDVILGSVDAPVEIVEFGDYQCPFCAKFFSQNEAKLRDEYIKTGKAKMVYRDFAFLGPESEGAALASQCAADQGKFWLYHDALYKTEAVDGRENNGNLTAQLFGSLAGQLGLDAKKFSECLNSQKYKEEVMNDYDDGVAAGVQGTPAVFVNGKLLQGALPYAQFRALIEEALAKATLK